MFLRLSNITNKSIWLISKVGRAPAARIGRERGGVVQRSLDWVEYIQNTAEKKKKGEEKVWGR